ncbi:ECF transporter S component [Clostridium taeniosporum]|uniref:ECF transporter S component n=1 Tax=Clostridium taeniosporum TaxID=394958 RepID=A0A1D7XME1_9CLOT|nr:ECF transporter S component [Clostridium taeniosporum]AOR24515.1 ECF transporter S component [Clostridium taeniosporum]
MQSEGKTLNVKELVLMGLMIALVYLAGSIIKIPSIGGFVHIGDCMVFLSVILLGKKKGAITSALGMFLVDILGGYYFWAPFTLIIKGIMAYIAGYILEKMQNNNSFINYTVAFIISGIFMVIGYFIAGTIMAGFLTEKIGIVQGLIYASKDIVGNIIQVTTGVVIALPLSGILIKAKKEVFN